MFNGFLRVTTATQSVVRLRSWAYLQESWAITNDRAMRPTQAL